ncbi:MAG: 6-bladed beta-propeller [Promethearchaeota archaeon]
MLVESKKPVYTCGGETSNRYYTSILKYFLDRNGKAYIWDQVKLDHIDVYDNSGKFLFDFGRKGQGPDEFQALTCVAVDREGNIWINDGNHKSLKIFFKDGKFMKEILLPDEIKPLYMQKMVFNTEDVLYILCSSNKGEIFIFKYDTKDFKSILIYNKKRRMKVSFVYFIPDFALDEEGNVYITDSFEYKVYKYSKEGALIKTFENKKAKKEAIDKKDFNIFDNNMKIIRYPGYREILNQLKGQSRYFPVIFGINIDQGLMYVWTSRRNGAMYIIDVYDLNFCKVGTACYFNLIRENLAQILNGKLYIPSIENYDPRVTDYLGKLGLSNAPEQLNVYMISKEIMSR